MALKEFRLEKVAQFGNTTKEAGVLSLWHYSTTDTIAQVAAADYFDAMGAKGMQAGDLIEAHCSDGVQKFRVSAAAVSGDVTLKKTGFSRGQATTVAASDTIDTGLTTVAGVVATLNDAPVAGCQFVTADIGDQAGAPAAGSFLLKTWKATATADTALIAATTFAKKVNWIAWGH